VADTWPWDATSSATTIGGPFDAEKVDAPRVVSCDDRARVGPDGQPDDRRVRVESAETAAVVEMPDRHLAVGRRQHSARPVAGDRERADTAGVSGERPQRGTAADVPRSRHVVPAGGDGTGSIRRHGDVGHPVLMSREREGDARVGDVPHFHRGVAAAGHELCSVPGDGDTGDDPLVPLEHAQLGGAIQIPEPEGAVLARRYDL